MEDIFEARRERLKELINSLNIKDKTFAERINKKPAVLSQLLTGYRKISTDFAYDIAKHYEWFNPEWLISGKGEMRRWADYTREIDTNFVLREPEVNDVERLRAEVLEKYPTQTPLTVKQDLALRQACYKVMVDNAGAPWAALVVGAGVYLRFIEAYPSLQLPDGREEGTGNPGAP
ncbi:XRE family transcriptional regulator [Candidatus Dependentiae bacterium]|nr:MAG: XRE family transcriptional regulator [Candidatus Dependentiae bacterium]